MVGAPPLTYLRGVLAKPETRSAEAGAAIASRRNGAFAPESWDRSASRPLVDRRSAKILFAIFETLTSSSHFSRTGIF